MKRKRGHKNKKGKPKGPSVPVVVVNLEENENLDESGGGGGDNDDNIDDSGMEVDTPSSTGTDQQQQQQHQHYNVANINPDGSIGRGGGKSVGRVKVKLVTPKTKESQLTSSEAYTLSDTDKSSQQMGLERQGVLSEKMEDSANSLSKMKSGNVSKKAGSIKIKPSKSLGSSISHSDPVPARSESPHEKELHRPHLESRYNKQELDTSLTVIKKVMKMDAAEPFNVPVNPEALGIPDYFDVIDTPMDLGTICSNLELGIKYRNSEDVYKDVQYIWDNCYKYNNKGDYILDLMRRVKKNFAKYWTAAGLYSGQSTGTSGVESSQENISPSDQGKVHMKGGQIKQKTRKGHGRRHKSDCLCAICVLKRRRREREENAHIVKSPLGASDNNLSQEFRQEESSHAESPSGENSSSDMDGSLDPNADATVEETEEVKMGVSKQQFDCPSREKQEEEEDDDEEDEEEESEMEMKDEGNGEGLQQLDKSREEPNEQLQPMITEKLDAAMQTDKHEGAIEADNKEKEAQEIHKKVKASENLQFENPMLVDLCGILFPKNSKSIWSGPHSLVQHRTSHTSSIHAVINMLMK
ncbi:putative chromatin remodeler Bromodomain family [Rosa chinensis]|uniref:Putative chromatin remodeler Bromodomain family n=1 Tax=Rosa chinensis TaxID=74649 RepID=A0A2P6PCV5_ROSCH|nr:bromodomain-containing protein bet-1 [Rosa chinensis]XP_024173168.1 bromodomain-containing protein bet-1 [Rosa chinensis]XP_040367633.1 bromodomain-containing protein bet-1 [Rosa chinensis]XP_040367634.1 bromodomain-containing protein bet-1 [Rosa chinensis]PRQ19752.1 putative chromatin remodeler Bromodomain family [Rosa chinensis]